MAESFIHKLLICNTLGPANISSIDKICVFNVWKSVGHSCIYITKEDSVFAMGENEYGCLGLGDTRSRMHPEKISQLCQKQIKSITSDFWGHMLAVTTCGQIFSWGNNEFGQLGNGNRNHGLIPFDVTNNLQHKKIKQAACGWGHSMALTNDGEIFAWGSNHEGQIGSGSSDCQLYPRKISIGKAISVACGKFTSVALLCNGEVYGWGHNEWGQLGIGNTDNQSNPCKVEALSGVVIKQIVCVPGHTLALSNEGFIYSWGYNSEGQLGTGGKNDLHLPHKILSDERYIEIAASTSSATSAGITRTGDVFMWGKCDGRVITSPFLTEVSSTDDIFVSFSDKRETWRMYSVVWQNPLGVILRKCDNNDSAIAEHFSNTEKIYSMKGMKTGVRVLVINNKTFTGKAQDTGKPLADRGGTDIDGKALDLLFKQLGYMFVRTETNLTGEGITSTLENEAGQCETTDNAFICVIMSHGTIDSVYGVDGKLVKWQHVFGQFNGKQCPNLVGKPKIFFIQACRGDKLDRTGDETDSTVELNNELAGLGDEADSAVAYPTMADMLVSTATTEGLVSWRNRDTGSWYIQALVQAIQKYAYKCDIHEILTETNKLILKQATTGPGYRQCAEKRDTFSKKFYFFPGFEEQEEQGVRNIGRSCAIS